MQSGHMTPTDILTAAALTGYPRALAAQQLGISVPRLLQLTNQLLDDPATANDPAAIRLRAARAAARTRRQTAGRL